MSKIASAVLCIIVSIIASTAQADWYTQSTSGSVYQREAVRSEGQVTHGVVEVVRPVGVESSGGYVGTGAGAAIGAIVANRVGNGNGRLVATALGGVLGGIAGAKVERALTREQGLEIQVHLDSGPSIVVVQGADETFYVGDRVRIIRGPGGTRIVH